VHALHGGLLYFRHRPPDGFGVVEAKAPLTLMYTPMGLDFAVDSKPYAGSHATIR
jgi:hypothetical protein